MPAQQPVQTKKSWQSATCSKDDQQSEVCTLRARREGLVAKPGSSVVTLDDPVREEQVLEESVMHKDIARSHLAEPVSAQRPFLSIFVAERNSVQGEILKWGKYKN